MQEVINPIYAVLRYVEQPASLRSYREAVNTLEQAFAQPAIRDEPFVLPATTAPLLKTILLAQRRAVASSVDERRSKTLHPDTLAVLDAEVQAFDVLAQEAWFVSASARSVPSLAEYLNLEEVEQILRDRQVRLPNREFDEKFHVLQAPRLALLDLAYYRAMNSVRGNPVALAFIDIDNFKRLNTELGHEMVDTTILPVFMRALESFMYARGFAYRMGGDEYVAVFANGRGAPGTCRELLDQMRGITYPGLREPLTISIGLVSVMPDCELSDRAVYERANRAMRYVKDAGKNCIGTYSGGFLDSHLTRC